MLPILYFYHNPSIYFIVSIMENLNRDTENIYIKLERKVQKSFPTIIESEDHLSKTPLPNLPILLIGPASCQGFYPHQMLLLTSLSFIRVSLMLLQQGTILVNVT